MQRSVENHLEVFLLPITLTPLFAGILGWLRGEKNQLSKGFEFAVWGLCLLWIIFSYDVIADKYHPFSLPEFGLVYLQIPWFALNGILLFFLILRIFSLIETRGKLVLISLILFIVAGVLLVSNLGTRKHVMECLTGKKIGYGCYGIIAKSKFTTQKLLEVCSQIPSIVLGKTDEWDPRVTPQPKNECYVGVAVSRLDKTLCQHVSGQYGRQQCNEYIEFCAQQPHQCWMD